MKILTCSTLLSVLTLLFTGLVLDLVRGGVVISEFMASNANGIGDEDGDKPDWIEIFNDSPAAVDLLGWRLTDNALDPGKWIFPSRLLPPGDTLLVFASGKDRKPAVGELHANFQLKAEGEYLGLSDPGGGIVHEFAPLYPVQVSDVSYGLPVDNLLVLAAPGAPCEVGVPVSQSDYDTNFANWRTSLATFTGSSWQTGAHTGVGYDDPGAPYGSLIGIGGDLGGRLDNFQSTACLRVPFQVSDPSGLSALKLRMKWDDGFAAFINGAEVAADLAPAARNWDRAATDDRGDEHNDEWTEFTIPAASVPLQAGTNILAIHGFNRTADSSDFLLLPVLEGILSTTTGGIPPTWFHAPTPGEVNGAGGSIGPALAAATNTIARPSGSGSSPAEAVSVTVTETLHPLGSVWLHHRTMFDPELSVEMQDAGNSPDTVAGDGVYSAWLPTDGPAAGEMLRWRFEAFDDHGNAGRAPAFPDPLDSDEYFGTVVLDADTDSSQLPVLHWFVQDLLAPDTWGGTRASFFFNGEFYDNVQVDLHGQSSASFVKKSYDLDFNRENRFRWKDGEPRVKDINLLTNYADRTKARNTICHEIGELSGTPYHFTFPVRVERNGAFHGVWDMMEDGDDRMLERNGLDPNGAFYKMYQHVTSSTTGIKKKTRTEEDNSDLADLVAGVATPVPLIDRRTYGYDHVNLPATVNYLATRMINSDRDHGHKNYYLYRDTEGTREWQPLVWDVDLSYGHNWRAGPEYFDDVLRPDNDFTGNILDNRLYNVIYDSPELRQMLLRRTRTLMDTLLEAPGTIDGLMETRLRGIAAMIDPDPANPSAWTDGDRDHARWGTWGAGHRCREEVERVISDYLQPRRSFLFNQDPGTRLRLFGDPIPDLPQVNVPDMVDIAAIDFLPVSGTQTEEYIQLQNQTGVAVDLSGWSLSGAVDHVFEGGTVIPAGDGSSAMEFQGLLHVVKDAVAFRARSTGPTGGELRLVQGNYRGQLSARGETIELRDPSGQLIDSFTYRGTPTVLQQALRISEISYNPAPPSPAESAAMPKITGADFEFLEFVNIGGTTIDLLGAQFTNGLEFTFPSTVIPPGGRVVLARNPAALALRYGTLPVPVLGPSLGSLSGAGERIELVDPVGEVILDFTFRDGWYPATDGGGRTLVARDPAGTPPNGFGEAEVWAISLETSGSPGTADPQFAQAYDGWDNFHFTSLERADPLIAGLHADPDDDGWINLLEYAFGGDPWLPEGGLVPFVWTTAGANLHAAVRSKRPVNAIDLQYVLLASDTPAPAGWSVVGATIDSTTPAGQGLEEVVHRELLPASGTARYLRLEVSMLP